MWNGGTACRACVEQNKFVRPCEWIAITGRGKYEGILGPNRSMSLARYEDEHIFVTTVCETVGVAMPSPALSSNLGLLSTTTTTTTMPIVQFAPFSSLVQPTFWHELTRLKIDVLKLSDESVPITATYAPGKTIIDRETGQEIALGCTISVGGDSFGDAVQ